MLGFVVSVIEASSPQADEGAFAAMQAAGVEALATGAAWGTMEWLHLQDGCSYIVPDKFAGAYAPCSCRPSSQPVTSTRE